MGPLTVERIISEHERCDTTNGACPFCLLICELEKTRERIALLEHEQQGRSALAQGAGYGVGIKSMRERAAALCAVGGCRCGVLTTDQDWRHEPQCPLGIAAGILKLPDLPD